MTNQETLELALEVLKSATPKYTRQRKDQKTLGGALDYWRLEQHQRLKAIKALEEALAKQEQGEPVAWRVSYPNDPELGFWFAEGIGGEGCLNEPLFTTPQQRKPLTDEQIKAIRVACGDPLAIHIEFARAIEAAHGIKE